MGFVKKHPVISMFLLLLLCGLFLLTTHLLFKTDFSNFFTAPWGAGDILNFGISMFAFIGTLFLGYMAFLQGEKSNEMNKRLIDIENRRHIIETSPLIVIKNIEYNDKEYYSSGIYMVQTDILAEDKCPRAFCFSVYNYSPFLTLISEPSIIYSKNKKNLLLFTPDNTSEFSNKLFPIAPNDCHSLNINTTIPKGFEEKGVTLILNFKIKNHAQEYYEYSGHFSFCIETFKLEMIDFAITQCNQSN